MRVLWAVLAILAAPILGELLNEEIRGQLDRLPSALIRLTARRLPADVRDDLTEEWTAELHEILRGAEALPITRLYRGTRYGLGLLWAAPSIGRTLSPALPQVGDINAASRRLAVASSVVRATIRSVLEGDVVGVAADGSIAGSAVGAIVGVAVGSGVGIAVGAVGGTIGSAVGVSVGGGVGYLVGIGIGGTVGVHFQRKHQDHNVQTLERHDA